MRDLYLMDPDGSNVRRVFKRKAKGRKEGIRHGLPMANSLFTVTRTGIVGEFGLYLGTFGEEDAERTPECGVPLSGRLAVPKSPFLYRINSGLD